MKKFIKNLSTIDRVLQFELDQLRLQFGQLQTEIDQISGELAALQSHHQEQRILLTDNPDYGMTFNAYENWSTQSSHQMVTNIDQLDQQIEELHGVLVEKFQDSKKINQTLAQARSQLKVAQGREEQKTLDQLGELRFHLNKLKVKEA
ncbi:hypothetical protein [Candidatus Paracaedibacter symbiosus]|uniref:hypothetical protein n=1 Tax=Candidatus Paracaedibacter symbiosus TaxID=244582 RepID=UPI0005096682|nr:hypothetical protein [Candidatus Paracaedibacter symbiosus]